MIRLVCYYLWSEVICNTSKQSPFKQCCGWNHFLLLSMCGDQSIKFRIKDTRHTWKVWIQFTAQMIPEQIYVRTNGSGFWISWFDLASGLDNESAWWFPCLGWLLQRIVLNTTDSRFVNHLHRNDSRICQQRHLIEFTTTSHLRPDEISGHHLAVSVEWKYKGINENVFGSSTANNLCLLGIALLCLPLLHNHLHNLCQESKSDHTHNTEQSDAFPQKGSACLKKRKVNNFWFCIHAAIQKQLLHEKEFRNETT